MPSGLPERLRNLARIASLVNSGTELPDILRRISVAVCQRSLWSSSAIMAVDRTSGYSVLVARHDPYFDAADVGDDRWLLETSPTRQVLESGTPLVIADAQEGADYPAYQKEARQRDYRTVVLLPLPARDECGREMVMSVHAHEPRAVDEDELIFLETAAHLASLAVEKAHRLHLEQQQAARARRALEVHASAMEHVLAGESLSAVVDAVAASLSYPLLLVDFTANQVVARGSPLPELVSDEAWAVVATEQGARRFADLVRSAEPSRFSSRRRIDLAFLDLDAGVEAYVEPLVVDGAVLGGLILFPGAGNLDAFDALVAEEVRFALAVQLMRSHIRFATQAETHADFFGRLFSGNWRDRGETLARAGHLGLPVGAPARLVVLALAPEDQVSLSADHRSDLLRALMRTARRLSPGSAAFFDSDAFTVFLPQATADDAPLRPLVQLFVDEVAWAAKAKPIAVLSRLCARLEDYQAARADCARLVGLARRIGRKGVVTDADFGPLARLLAAADATALQGFVTGTLGAIEAFDCKHRSDFLVTLDEFLRNACRYQSCADALGIHVTTLRYRLRRLKELFGLDLEDSETRLALELALRIRSAVGDGMVALYSES